MQKNLPKIYCFVDEYNLSDLSKLSKNINIIYRNYDNIDHKNNILKLKKFCKSSKNKFYLSNNIKLSIQLGLDGIYIPSFNKNTKHLSYSFRKDFKIIGSAHNLKEIRIKEKQKVDKVFLSSLFKKNKNFLGVNKFKLLAKLTNKNIVVLGGISKKNFKKLSLLNQTDFAGISYFE